MTAPEMAVFKLLRDRLDLMTNYLQERVENWGKWVGSPECNLCQQITKDIKNCKLTIYRADKFIKGRTP